MRVRKADPRIESAGYEDDDSYWIYLAPGWISIGTETHAIHEDSMSAAVRELCWVVPCGCQECRDMIAKQ
jgi:hypothetical protein